MEELSMVILRASEFGDLEVVKKLLEKNANINHKDDHQQTPMHLVAQNKHDEMVELLLKSGAPAFKGHEEIVNILLKAGAAINSTDLVLETSKLHSVNNQHIPVVELLLKANAAINAKNKNGWTPLRLAANSGNGVLLKLLLNRGAIVNAKNNVWSYTCSKSYFC
ncbi:hypothetical protein THRCLA_20134 [Thraustotheca clavata]|uniref:Uncharacterized protein n=1 Tax=Thraustotheca clavata TaxID=74557 RepID=A0A1W0AB72_9STRA|nr:hypothetical protein THRCLA_20134 [Thraustotheca clavata]